MRNSIVLITENAEKGRSIKTICTSKDLDELDQGQYKGGFKRYEIDIYDETEEKQTLEEKGHLLAFLTEIWN